MTLSLPSPRRTNLFIFAACTALMVFALFLEHYLLLKPCPLCITQRALIVLIGLTAFIAWLHGPTIWGSKIYGVVTAFWAVLGIIVAGRHVWLQHLPEGQAPACGPDLSYMIDVLPIMDVIVMLFQGDGNCADTVWEFLWLSIPEWTLIVFIGLLGTAVWQIFRK